jgi:hypothetical protein
VAPTQYYTGSCNCRGHDTFIIHIPASWQWKGAGYRDRARARVRRVRLWEWIRHIKNNYTTWTHGVPKSHLRVGIYQAAFGLPPYIVGNVPRHASHQEFEEHLLANVKRA